SISPNGARRIRYRSPTIWRQKRTGPPLNSKQPTTGRDWLHSSRPEAAMPLEERQRPGNATPAAKAATGAYTPSGVSPSRRARHKYTVRLWAVRHSRFLEWFYHRFAEAFLLLHPIWNAIGYGRVERPVTFVERNVKGFLFDCRMCGQCVLSSTGMSCPMNCPKNLRNGPCGGVRANGHCEVRPEMKCVWVQAVAGATRIPGGMQALQNVQLAGDRRVTGHPSCVGVVARRVGEPP